MGTKRMPKRPTILQALEASPTLRIELAAGFVCDLAVILDVGVDGLCAFHAGPRTMLPTGCRQYTASERRVHANFVKRAGKGLSVEHALTMVPADKRQAARDEAAQSVALARCFVEESTRRAAARSDQALAA